MSSVRTRLLAFTSAIAATATLTAITPRPADAATSGFPPAGVPFALQTSINGQTACLTEPATVINGSHAGFAPCSLLDLDPRQEWHQVSVDANGYGLITDNAGNCLADPHGVALITPATCATRQASPASAPTDRWKQLSDGRVDNAYKRPVYWFIAGIKTTPFVSANTSGNAVFDALILDIVP